MYGSGSRKQWGRGMSFLFPKKHTSQKKKNIYIKRMTEHKTKKREEKKEKETIW